MARALLVILLAGVLFAGMAADVRAEIVWHGYTLNRVYQPQGGPTRFRTDRISLSAAAEIDPKISAYVEWYFHPFVGSTTDSTILAKTEPYRIYLESAYTDIKLPPGVLRIGKGRRNTFGITPSYPNRKTTNYGIFSEAFTQDRVQGVQYFWTKDGLDVGIGFTTALRLGNRGIGDVTKDSANRVNNLADRDVPHEINENMELSARIGAISKSGIRYGITGSTSKLDDLDVAFINTNFGSGHTSKTRDRLGAYLYYPWNDFVLISEYMDAQSSDIGHSGWYVTGGYQPKGLGPKAFVRYAQLNVDAPSTDNQYTWDKQQISFSVVKPVRPTVWFQFEYERNMESPGAGLPDVKNDIAFLELFTGF